MQLEKLKNQVVKALKVAIEEITEEYKDVYAVSLMCSAEINTIEIIANTKAYLEEQVEGDDEDYWYYKYCEEEWEIWEGAEALFKEISNELEEHIKVNEALFVDKETSTYTDAFEAYREQVIQTLIEALKQVRLEEKGKDNMDILLNLYIREYLDEEERVKIFKMLNAKNTWKEYEANIEEFC